MPNPADPFARDAEMARIVAAFTADTESALASLSNLMNNPGRDRAHTHLEAIRLVTQVREGATMRAEMLALNARAEPLDVPLRRLADALQLSVNALRARINAKAADRDDPFAVVSPKTADGVSDD